MTPMFVRDDETRAYYDEFAQGYETARRPNDATGYHAMLDDLEVGLVERYGAGKAVLEVGAGTGLLLERIAGFAADAQGVDLSPGMLEKAKARGLSVCEGSATDLPFEDERFDVTCSFKVLAHVPDIGRALSEMARVTKRGGVVLAEFYNPYSFRGLVKRFGPAGKISGRTKESAVYTRFDPTWRLPRIMPPGCTLEGWRGIRIVTPAAAFWKVPGLRDVLRTVEVALSDTPAAHLAGFAVAIIRKS